LSNDCTSRLIELRNDGKPATGCVLDAEETRMSKSKSSALAGALLCAAGLLIAPSPTIAETVAPCAHGRIKVRFFWDAARDGSSSRARVVEKCYCVCVDGDAREGDAQPDGEAVTCAEVDACTDEEPKAEQSPLP
jgi:hypothetical protein